MTVAHSLPAPTDGGLSGRPGVQVDGCPNVFLAGDWVGSEGMLADASAASAREAAGRVLEAVERPASAPRWGAYPMRTRDDVFEEHRPMLARLAYRMLGSLPDADDVVQEAYLRWTHGGPGCGEVAAGLPLRRS